VAEAAGPSARIKWPNDVLLDGGKVAGILAESRPQEGWAVLGIGLNVAVALEDLPAGVRAEAATMGLGPHDVEAVLDRLLVALERTFQLEPPDLLAAWSARDALAGEDVAWPLGHGRAAGIDGDGRLVVDLPGGGRTTLDAGEVHLAGRVGQGSA